VILVTGATGTTGQHVVACLRRGRTPVRALVRARSKGRALEALGAELAVGDFDLPKTLGPALHGVDVALLLAPPHPRQVEWQDGFVVEAKRIGVRRIVKISGLGADERSEVPFLRWHGEGERRLEGSGLSWTHVRPSMFMQNLLGQASEIRRGVLALPLADARVAMVDVRDVAEVAARVLAEEGHERKAYDVTGPEALSGAEAAKRLSDALGWKVAYRDVPPDGFRAGLGEAGLPSWLADAVAALYADLRKGSGARTTDVVFRLTRTPPRPLETFARDHVAVFRGPEA